MFGFGFRDPFGSKRVSCVKVPAAVAFPTDDRLLQRIEELRRALPANNVKALWKNRELALEQQPLSQLRDRDGEKQVMIRMPTCVVPLARAAGAHARARDGLSASAA